MSVAAMNWAYSLPPVGDALARAVLVTLADRADETNSCWPGFEDIARRCEISERTARRKVDFLEEKGLLRRARKRRQDGTLGVYRFTLILEEEPPDNLTSGQPDQWSETTPPPDTGVTDHRTPVSAQNPHRTIKESTAPRAREASSDVENYLSGYPEALEFLREMEESAPRLTRGIWGAYGPSGTREQIWKGIALDDRPRLLATAIIDAGTDESRWKSNFFAAVVRRVIADEFRPTPEEEGLAKASRSAAGRLSAQEESRRDADRRARVRVEQGSLERVRVDLEMQQSADEAAAILAWLDALDPKDLSELNTEVDKRLREAGWPDGRAPPAVFDGIRRSVALERMPTISREILSREG